MTEEAITNEASTQTLAQELQAAFDNSNKPQEEDVVEDIVDEAEETSEETSEETTEDAPEDQVEKEFPLVPNEMSTEEKEAFQALLDSDDPDKRVAAEILIERYNNLKKGFYAKTEKFANETKELKDIQQVFKPFEQAMQQNGISKAAYMANMVHWEQALNHDPVTTVKQIMQKYGVTPDKIGASSNNVDFDDNFDYDNNKEVLGLKEQIQQLKIQVANQPVQAQLESFANATDLSGNLKHPHYKEVAPFMGTLIQTGKAQTLEEAYAKAIRVINDESSEPKDVVNVDLIKQRVAKSKRAAKSVRTSGTRPDFSKMSVSEELTARLQMS